MTNPDAIDKPANSQKQAEERKLSRRNFVAGAAATSIAMGMAQSVSAAAQGAQATVAPKPENALPKDAPAMYRGTAAGAVLAQLRAAGVRTLFHTNTSGFVPFWEAIYAAGDVQVINMTHEGAGGGRGGWLHDGQQEPRVLLRQPRRHLQRAEQHLQRLERSRPDARHVFGRQGSRTGKDSLRVVGQHSSDRPNRYKVDGRPRVRRRHRALFAARSNSRSDRRAAR